MVVGFLAGMGWYELSGWGIANFAYGIHPVWLGMSANILVLVLASLFTSPAGWSLAAGAARYWGGALLIIGAVLAVVATDRFAALRPTGLLGLVIFLAALSLSLGIIAALRPREERLPAAAAVRAGSS
jgi:SSS family solute:Na+ symporter